MMSQNNPQYPVTGNNQFNPYNSDVYHNTPVQYDNNQLNNFSNMNINSSPAYQSENMYNNYAPHMPPNMSSAMYGQPPNTQLPFAPNNQPVQPAAYPGNVNKNFYPNSPFPPQTVKDNAAAGHHSTNKEMPPNTNQGLYNYPPVSSNSFSPIQSQLPPQPYPGAQPQTMPLQSPNAPPISQAHAPMGSRYANSAPQTQSLNPEFMPSAVQVGSPLFIAPQFGGCV